MVQEGVQLWGRVFFEPAIDQAAHFLIVLGLRMRMGVVAARMAADIAVEVWADVPEFMHDRDELLTKVEILETWQIEAEDIEHLTAT